MNAAAKIPLFPIAAHALSISDDDLCSNCTHLLYRPGETSECKKSWPGMHDEDGYVQVCAQHDEVAAFGDNLAI